VCCSVLQYVVVRCTALQRFALFIDERWNAEEGPFPNDKGRTCRLQCVAVCCSVLQCVAERCSVLQHVAVRCSALQCVAVTSGGMRRKVLSPKIKVERVGCSACDKNRNSRIDKTSVHCWI